MRMLWLCAVSRDFHFVHWSLNLVEFLEEAVVMRLEQRDDI